MTSDTAYKRTTTGFVVQNFDKDGEPIDQEFVAGEEQFEDVNGEPLVDEPKDLKPFLLHMEQPTPAVTIADTHPRLEIPEIAWTDARWAADQPEGSRLLTPVVICGVYFHAEAIEVAFDGEGRQVAVHPSLEQQLVALNDIDEPDGPWFTVSIGGRPYVLILHPHCR